MSACASCATELSAGARFCSCAVDNARSWGSVVLAARCEAELGAVLARQGRDNEAAPYLASARSTYESLGAHRWLRDLDRSASTVAVES